MAESCDRIVHSLRRLGIEIDLVHLTHHLQKEKIEIKRMGRYVGWPIGQDPAHALNCLWDRLARFSEEERYTHVVAFGGSLPLLAGPIFSAWLGVPLVTLIRGNDFDAAVFSPRRGEILREAMERSARVCVVSREKAAKINALYPKARTVWVPNGIDLTGWEPLPSDCRRAAEWRAANVRPGKRVLGLFGHIKQKKGGLFFVENLLDSGYADSFHLLFIGEVGEEIVEYLKLHEGALSYTLIPFVDRYELLAYYPACDWVVVPSFYDGLPNVVLEAAALGIPLLASTAGGLSDVLVNERHGFLFAPGDSEDCRRAISLAARSEELPRLGEECRRLVRTDLTHDVEAGRYLSVLVETASAKVSRSEPECSTDFVADYAGEKSYD
jgi:glycosyltransferase involved in cell wall biosynthesis